MLRSRWVIGDCWRCEDTELPVMWLGPVQTADGTAPFHVCESCIARLEELVRAFLYAPTTPAPEGGLSPTTS